LRYLSPRPQPRRPVPLRYAPAGLGL